MTKLAIVTCVIGEAFKKIWAVTRPTFEAYADRIGADLVVIENNPHNATAHWAKFAIYELLHKTYRRALFLDADMIIRDDCPDLFALVPEKLFAAFNEGLYTPRAMAIYEAMSAYKMPLPAWDRRSYYNTGVMVVSQDQRHLFSPPTDLKSTKYSFGEQTYLNLRIFDRDVPRMDLGHKFNRMSIMDTITGVSRLDSYIVHYAGAKIIEPGLDLPALIRSDLERWKGPRRYQPTLFLNVGGGLGDQVCAEPVLRYIRDDLYREADIYMITAFPELFTHLADRISISVKPPEKKFDAVFSMTFHPDKETPHPQTALNTVSHPIDYISMAALKRILPDDDKTIFLPVTQRGKDEVARLSNGHEDEFILVHPGAGWPSKTFPVEWWQAVLDGLMMAGKAAGIIGKQIGAGHGYVEVNGGGHFDFRDRLSIEGLIVLISKAPVLITNDSAPLHIAGAFDNEIILVPTCKHPDHLMPYRQGRKDYKAQVLYKELACNGYYFRPSETNAPSLTTLPGPMERYLPDPELVVTKALEALGNNSHQPSKEFILQRLEGAIERNDYEHHTI